MQVARSAAGLSFVPTVYRTVSGATWLVCAGRCWDVSEWKPGKADFRTQPSTERLVEACRALASLHLAWQSEGGARHAAVCPAVLRRRQLWHEWQKLTASGWRPSSTMVPFPEAVPLIERAWQLLPSLLKRLPIAWLLADERVEPIHPCLCDLWHDHLLFEGDRLTGLVDYGSVKMDHPAVDLARMLGSLVEDDAARWQTGLQAYLCVRPLSDRDEVLARQLDRFGVVLALTKWVRWLCLEHRQFENWQAAAGRIEALLRRLERW